MMGSDQSGVCSPGVFLFVVVGVGVYDLIINWELIRASFL
jgi:hypothetical protein